MTLATMTGYKISIMATGIAAYALAIAGISAITSPAGAYESKSYAEIADRIFQSADRDGDGVLTETEYASAGLDGYGASFPTFDENADGSVVIEEYRSVFVRFHNTTDEREA